MLLRKNELRGTAVAQINGNWQFEEAVKLALLELGEGWEVDSVHPYQVEATCPCSGTRVVTYPHICPKNCGDCGEEFKVVEFGYAVEFKK